MSYSTPRCCTVHSLDQGAYSTLAGPRCPTVHSLDQGVLQHTRWTKVPTVHSLDQGVLRHTKVSHSTLPGPKCPTTHSSDQDAALLMKTKKGNNSEEGDSSVNLDPPDKQEVETDDPNVTPNIPSHKLLRN